jgi:hypothetical protein
MKSYNKLFLGFLFICGCQGKSTSIPGLQTDFNNSKRLIISINSTEVAKIDAISECLETSRYQCEEYVENIRVESKNGDIDYYRHSSIVPDIQILGSDEAFESAKNAPNRVVEITSVNIKAKEYHEALTAQYQQNMTGCQNSRIHGSVAQTWSGKNKKLLLHIWQFFEIDRFGFPIAVQLRLEKNSRVILRDAIQFDVGRSGPVQDRDVADLLEQKDLTSLFGEKCREAMVLAPKGDYADKYAGRILDERFSSLFEAMQKNAGPAQGQLGKFCEISKQVRSSR